jgi:NADH-quinone oxidoreductase subunit L
MLGTIPEAAVWAIILLPLGAFITTAYLSRSQASYAALIAIGAVGVSFLLSLWALDSVIQSDGVRIDFSSHELLAFANVEIDLALNLDGLSGIMLVVVTSVSLLVQYYSQGYMHGDPGYGRYYAYISLFTMSMLGLVLMDSLVLIYVFWEMVGLCSYLLIGFWFDRPAAAAAAKKAFLVTRMGDLGFLLAILLIYVKADTFNVAEIQELALVGALGSTTITVFALGIFAGAAGKSAQVPFHVWLPDAMEGPTPVSALIHAATMVAAGVYLVARMFPVFHASDDAMTVVGLIGGITAISAALIGLVMTDIKRVLAYSTISQLGYMMLALGVGGYVAAIFHLFTHAFFKALLFLGSGSVNHATNTFDMRLMGGLKPYMPITFATFLIGSLSLSGIFPLAGFWSKDEILSDAWAEKPYLFWIALVTAGLTAFYMFRAIFMTFYGEYRGGAAEEHDETPALHEEHAATTGHGATPHESEGVMTLPLIILAVPAVLAGFANVPFLNKEIEHLLVGALPIELGEELHETEFRMGIAIASTVVAMGGIALAWAIYYAKLFSAERLQATFAPVHALLANKYYLDVLYERIIVGFLFYEVVAKGLATFDRVVIDGTVNGVGAAMRQGGAALRTLQNGQFQTYGAVAFASLVTTVVVVLALNPP